MQNLMIMFNNFLMFLVDSTGNLGWAIIALTLLIRSILLPLTLPSLQARQKIQELQPELNKLKKKHQGNKQALQLAQLELYKRYNVNPLSGCLPQLVQIALLIFLYQALIGFLGNTGDKGVNTIFFWLDLSSPDEKFVLPILAGVSQLVLSLMIAPGAETPDAVPNKSKSKKIKAANEKEEDFAEMAASMQQQMLFIMPVMTGVIALKFPAGLALYWVITTLFSIGQQYLVSGWGGLTMYAQRMLVMHKFNRQK